MAPSLAQIAAGADAGASLIKLAVRDAGGRLALECFDARASEHAAARIHDAAPTRLGLTGCGAPSLAALLGRGDCVEEFDAWATGARLRLYPRGQGEPFLMVSIGTGTSALLVTPDGARRVGGTSLGGGTLLGLGSALLGTRDFEEIAALAVAGDRSQVDLMVGDIYGDDFELPALLTASSLAKLGVGSDARPADLAQAIMGLIGENVGRTCALLAQQQGVRRVVFGGSCLRGNDSLAHLLRAMCLVAALEVEILEDGEYTGAMGALHLAEALSAA